MKQMVRPCSWTLAASLLLVQLTVASHLMEPPKTVRWASVGEPAQEQAAHVAEWAQEAQREAANADAAVQQVEETAAKAKGSMAGVLAEVGATKAAMERTLAAERKISMLRDQMWQKAKDAAMAEVPKMLPELREEAEKKANEEAKKKATVFKKKMDAKAKVEIAKASKVYMDQLHGASRNAAEYAKLGDSLVGQASNAQMVAGVAQSQAGDYIRLGQMDEAQKLLQSSRQEMNVAFGLNAQANGMYNTANKIASQFPAYAGQAAMAAYHAQAMYDPNVQPPPAPLVLSQQRKEGHAKRSLRSS